MAGKESEKNLDRVPSLKERYEADLRTLENSFQNFVRNFRDLERDPDITADLKSLINIGRFRREQLDKDSALGFTGSKARIVYGDMVPEGNMEGSLYTLFGNDTLRVRWQGKSYVQVFMNGGHMNRFDLMPRKDGTFEAKVMYLGGELPFKHDEEGIWVDNPDYYEWRRQKDEYEEAVDRQNRNNKRWFGRPKQVTPLPPAPGEKPAENICIPYSDVEPVLKEIVAKLQKGFALTISTYEEALHMLRQPPVIEGKAEE